MRILFKTYILLIFGLNSCVLNSTEVEYIDAKEAFILNSSPSFKGYFYLGTDTDFHHFIAKWKYGRDKAFKIHKSEAEIENLSQIRGEERAVDLMKTKAALANKPKPLIILK